MSEKKMQENEIIVNKDNVHFLTLKILLGIDKKLNDFNNITNQMLEMNFYMAQIANKLAPDEVKPDKLKEHFKKLGIDLNG